MALPVPLDLLSPVLLPLLAIVRQWLSVVGIAWLIVRIKKENQNL